jgi:hypothetical protein
MSLLEPDEEKDEVIFDDENKIRLFETHQKTSRSIKDYAKTLLPIAFIVIAGLALVAYLMMPNVGDKVKAPAGLEDAVYDRILTQEKRTPTDMEFYYCKTYYWIRVNVEPINIPNKRPSLISKYLAIGTPKSDETWELSVVPLASENVPCDQ